MASTQKYIDISEIKNDVVVLKDGSLRAVLLCSSINFALKTEEEQKAIIQAYTRFLNAIDFPLQIVIQSRKLDIGPYLEELKEHREKITNPLLAQQMDEYMGFISELVELGEITTKKFYIVVPYNPWGDKKRSFWARLFSIFTAPSLIRLKKETFERYREALFKRVDFVISELNSMGIKALPLDTQSLIELYYQSYNPEEGTTEKLGKLEEIRIER